MISKAVHNQSDIIIAIFIFAFVFCCPIILGKSELKFQSFKKITNFNMTYTVTGVFQTRSTSDCAHLCRSDPSCFGFTRQNKTCTLLTFDKHSQNIHRISGNDIFIWLKRESTSNDLAGETTVPAIQTTMHELTTIQPMVEEFTCPQEFTHFSEGCFHLSSSEAEWEHARLSCESLHGHLVTLDTSEVCKLFHSPV